ncbi:transposase, partial [Xanthomonas oryzae pv. oryzae]
MPNAVAMQTWVTQLHAQLRQRGWPTQIELTQDSNLVWRSACTFSYLALSKDDLWKLERSLMGRPAKPLVVSADDRVQLESMARSQSLPAALSRRAQMILRMADGEPQTAIAHRYGVSRPTVTLWRTRYRERGIAGLHNELKPGRPRTTS